MSQAPQEPISRRYGITSVWAHLAMCVATAVMLTLAFPWPGWSIMAYFALVPVGVLAMRTRRLWTLAWTSYLVFVAWWALRTLWLMNVQTVAPLGIAVVCGAYFSVALVLLAAVQRRFRGAMTLTLPLFWCVQEFARNLWPVGGFAWFTLASSQAAWREDMHPGYLVQCADLFGWITVSFLVAMTSGLMVDLIARPLIKRRMDGAVRPRRTILVAVLLWVCCMSSAIIYGVQRLADTPAQDDPNARTVTIGIIQTNVPQSNKLEVSGDEIKQRRREDFDRLLEMSTLSANDDPRPDLIIWPETMVLRPVNDEAFEVAQTGGLRPEVADEIIYYRKGIQTFVEAERVPVVVGTSARGVNNNWDRPMNSALFVEPGAERWPRYSKMHLVPMGEYIPGPQWLRELFLEHMSPYDYDYTVMPGEGRVVFELPLPEVESPDEPAVSQPAPVRFATPICYEDVVSEQCRRMVYAGDGTKRADLLVNLTNDGWYAGSHQGFQHVQLAALRCIENRVPMARSVNTGVSGLIDSAGRVGPLVSEKGVYQEVAGYVNVVAVLDERSTLYGRVREVFPVGLCAVASVLLLGVFVPGTSRRRGESGPKGR